ncbi:MAG: ATP-dependent acyl-CoA ligase, partial [Rubrivivax sp.]
MRLSDFGFETRELTLGSILARQVRDRGDKVFLTWLPDGRRFTYRDMDRLSNRLAHQLLGLGLTKGAHVALMMENSPEHVLLAFALAKLGAVSVPLNTACRGQLLQYYLEQSDSTWVVTDADYRERVEATPAASAQVTRILTTAEIAALIDGATDESPVPVEVKCSDTAALAYTSGTTGPSKGNVLSQAASLSFGLSNAEHHGYVSDDVIYICLPLFHVNAMQSATHSALTSGASIVMTQRFSTSRFWKELRENGVTITNLLGSMVNFLWSQPESPSDIDNSVRMVSVVPTPRFAPAFEQRFGLKVTSSFGMS